MCFNSERSDTVKCSVSDKLENGIILPKMKHAQLVNSVLTMQEVSSDKIRTQKNLEEFFFALTVVLVSQGFLAFSSDAEVLLTD